MKKECLNLAENGSKKDGFKKRTLEEPEKVFLFVLPIFIIIALVFSTIGLAFNLSDINTYETGSRVTAICYDTSSYQLFFKFVDEDGTTYYEWFSAKELGVSDDVDDMDAEYINMEIDVVIADGGYMAIDEEQKINVIYPFLVAFFLILFIADESVFLYLRKRNIKKWNDKLEEEALENLSSAS